ncbi:MAG: ribulose-phosphate 3-epimerase [Oscillospiraceae bacterium]|nr:ribulose-phosphate 3-epimerase [Oscillospiraceae bacterium]
MRKFYTCASVLSADMRNLERVSKELETSGVDMLHFDVMDGVFVPNLSFGFPVLEAVDKSTDLFLDVHLMITDPLKYISRTIKAGADLITFHLESSSDPYETIEAIRKGGVKAGIVIKPCTPYEAVLPFVELVDVVLVMTVEPGFGGQSFMEDMLEKVKGLRKYIDERELPVKIQVDGGINDKTAAAAVSAGADMLVVGSFLFNQKEISNGVTALRNAVSE